MRKADKEGNHLMVDSKEERKEPLLPPKNDILSVSSMIDGVLEASYSSANSLLPRC